jgi:4-oxalocrotonate tautomerase
LKRVKRDFGALNTEEPYMPMISVEMFPGRTSEQKQRFAAAVTDGFVEICGGTRQSVQIVFVEVAKDDWATAGTLASKAAAATNNPTKVD